MTYRPFFLRGYSPTHFAETSGHTLPAVAAPIYSVPLQTSEGGQFLDTHRVIRLERDYWVSEEELSDLAASDELASHVARAALFWFGVTAVCAIFGTMAWLGWIPA
jgi:hypothetical protein